MNRIKIFQDPGCLKWFIEIDGLLAKAWFNSEEKAEQYIVDLICEEIIE